jgi:predicted lipoprotein
MKYKNKSYLARNILIALGFSTLLSLTACGGGGDSGADGSVNNGGSTGGNTGGSTGDSGDVSGTFDERPLLNSLVNDVITPTYAEFKVQAEAQHQAIGDYCSALDTGISVSDKKLGAQNAWKATMDAWQQVEMMQFGPLLKNDDYLRNNIYSWPRISTCNVDQEVAKAMNDDGFDISTKAFQRKGLAAIEYLLFSQDLNHSCQTTDIEGWNTLTDEDKIAARCDYAELAATDVITKAESVITTWQDPSALNSGAYLKASSDTELHSRLNAITDAMFYFDTRTKSDKLAKPMGIKENACGGGADNRIVCLQSLESRVSENSFANIVSNLKALKFMFEGSSADESLGFDDYLNELGEQETAQQMSQSIQTTIDLVEGFDTSLEAALGDDAQQQQLDALHTQMQSVSSLMKQDFMDKLLLELPQTAAGDGD